MSRQYTLAQLGEYCTQTVCKKCPIYELAQKHHHGCPECLRVPEIAEKVAQLLKYKRVERRSYHE